jgi:hypothetical protein
MFFNVLCRALGFTIVPLHGPRLEPLLLSVQLFLFSFPNWNMVCFVGMSRPWTSGWTHPLLTTMPSNASTFLVYMAYIEQSSAWDQAVCGCLSQHWSHLANASYDCWATLHKNDSQAYDQWTTRLVSSLWQYGLINGSIAVNIYMAKLWKTGSE